MIVFGPPSVTLHCSADYAKLNGAVEVSWKPTLLKNETESLSAEETDRIQTCEAVIECSNGYKDNVSTISQAAITPLYLICEDVKVNIICTVYTMFSIEWMSSIQHNHKFLYEMEVHSFI